MPFVDDVRSLAGRIGPATFGLVLTLVAVTVGCLLGEYKLAPVLMLDDQLLAQPWKLVTYPFVYGIGDAFSLIMFLCVISWMLWIGGSIERELGTVKYLISWVVFAALAALFVFLGYHVTGRVFVSLHAVILPVTAITVMWGFRNRGATILLFAMLPMNGFWIAIFAAALAFVEFAHPAVLGLFACLHLPIAYAYATDRVPGVSFSGRTVKNEYVPSKAQRQKEERFFDNVRKREQDRAERERLRKLFESSMSEDDKGEEKRG